MRFSRGEEDGLIGSKEIAANIEKLVPNVVTMINMDMIGRLDDKKVWLLAELAPLLFSQKLLKKTSQLDLV